MKSRKEKNELGQFITPKSIADFMAKILCFDGHDEVELLDAGTGTGSLTDSVLDLLHTYKGQIKVTHYDIDESLTDLLEGKYRKKKWIQYELITDDFIEDSLKYINEKNKLFSHAIQNPPYKKINSKSKERKNLSQAGIETVNLYSGFVAMTLLLLKEKGELVAIIPRSFCNGPYYKNFRQLIFETASIDYIHLFNSRSKPFRDEKVLQESLIIKFIKGKKQGQVTVSHSADDTFSDIESKAYAFSEIVKLDDPEKFIHIPNVQYAQTLDNYKNNLVTLVDLNIKVSTGPVVDFRVKEELCQMPGIETAPLIYPGHFKNHKLQWPQKDFKKPNAINNNENTRKWLYQSEGAYVVVNRFSTKDDKKRVVANVIECDQFDTDMIGFENHLNVFHIDKKGISNNIAYGLAAFLNSRLVDNYVRIFNGHTQINVADLKSLKYPSIEMLEALGEFIIENHKIFTNELDRKVVEVIEQQGKAYRRGA